MCGTDNKAVAPNGCHHWQPANFYIKTSAPHRGGLPNLRLRSWAGRLRSVARCGVGALYTRQSGAGHGIWTSCRYRLAAGDKDIHLLTRVYNCLRHALCPKADLSSHAFGGLRPLRCVPKAVGDSWGLFPPSPFDVEVHVGSPSTAAGLRRRGESWRMKDGNGKLFTRDRRAKASVDGRCPAAAIVEEWLLFLTIMRRRECFREGDQHAVLQAQAQSPAGRAPFWRGRMRVSLRTEPQQIRDRRPSLLS